MIPVQITMKDMPASPAIETIIRKRVEKLKRYYNRLCSCRVVINLPQKHKHQGKIYNIRIDITVPGKELVVTRKKNQDIYIAIRDAFDVVERKLDELSRKRHGRVKTHEDTMQGYVKRIIASEGYGFIQGLDGNEYYFSISNVNHHHFDKIAVGDNVEYFAVHENDGRQAHRVVLKERRGQVA